MDSEDEEDGPVLGQLVASSTTAAIPIRIALYVQIANVVWCLFVLMVGCLPYYYYLGAEPSRIGLVTCGIAFCVFYVLMSIATAHHREISGISCGVLWTLSCAGLVGFACAVLFNVAALQMVAISFGQSIALVIYLQLITNKTDARTDGDAIRWRWALPGMVVASALVWGASCYAFVVEGDWAFAAGLVVLAAALAAYNAWRLTTATQYGMNDHEVKQAIMEHYCAPLAAGIKRLHG